MSAKQIKKRSTSRVLTSVVIAATLAATITPVAAFGAPTDSIQDTAVKLYNESGQVTVAVPVSIPAAIAASDGSFVTANNARFENQGVFDVHVSKIGVSAASSVNLVAEGGFAAATDPSTIWAAVAPGTGVKVDLADYTTAKEPTVKDQWNIAGGESLAINLEGAMKNPGAAFTSATNAVSAPTAFTITWTIAAGTVS